MTAGKPVDIICAACGREALLVREPRYEGFTRVGETLKCAACGHIYPDEASVPFRGQREVKVFTEADRPRAVKVFKKGEAGRICRHCANYVVNPFLQRCSLHRREVEATDSCDRFTERPAPVEEKPPEKKKPIL